MPLSFVGLLIVCSTILEARMAGKVMKHRILKNHLNPRCRTKDPSKAFYAAMDEPETVTSIYIYIFLHSVRLMAFK